MCILLELMVSSFIFILCSDTNCRLTANAWSRQPLQKTGILYNHQKGNLIRNWANKIPYGNSFTVFELCWYIIKWILQFEFLVSIKWANIIFLLQTCCISHVLCLSSSLPLHSSAITSWFRLPLDNENALVNVMVMSSFSRLMASFSVSSCWSLLEHMTVSLAFVFKILTPLTSVS